MWIKKFFDVVTNSVSGSIISAADFLAPGSIELNRYQAEAFLMVKERFKYETYRIYESRKPK